ncbi:hypothetical protein AMTR_s00005p00179180, partial [Amborella trichopoda]
GQLHVAKPHQEIARVNLFAEEVSLAHGKAYALAQPVLCGMYHGLGAIACGKASSRDSKSESFAEEVPPGHGKASSRDRKSESFGGEVLPGRFTTRYPIHYVFGWLSAYFPKESNPYTPGAYEINEDLS